MINEGSDMKDSGKDSGSMGDMHGQTAQIRWSELERFFAAGQVLSVDSQLDLVTAAVAVAQDQTQEVKQWMEQGLVMPVTDQQAQEWQTSNTLLWSVVTAPWVLVQQR